MSHSDDKTSKKALLTHPDIIAAIILGVATIIAAFVGIAFLHWIKEPPKYGSFEVDARSRLGTSFTNEHNSTKNYVFTANGYWTYNPGLGVQHGPEGHPDYPKASESFILPGKPEGALVAEGDKRPPILVGAGTCLTLKPKETISFVINDVRYPTNPPPRIPGSFGDNHGSVMMQWKLVTKC